MNCCLVIPHYNHFESFKEFLPQLAALDLPCIVVDDGSEAQMLSQLRVLLADYSQVHFLAHGENRGKGAAIISGAHLARYLGYTHIFQIDADGQHNLADVSVFIAEAERYPNAIICGAPTFDDSAPKARVYGRKITDFWVALETLSLRIKDSLCGFRIYPLAELERVMDRYMIGRRMDVDTDILVKSSWQGIDMRFLETKVIYHDQGVSHFHYIRDNVRLIRLHTRLMCGMLLRSPLLIYAAVKRNVK